MCDQGGGESRSGAQKPADDLPPAGILSLDHVFEALSHPRRRYLCYTLLASPEWNLETLAAKIAAWENDTIPEAVTDERRNQVYVSLYHAHVPKLADEGIVSFDPDTETIAVAQNSKQVLRALEGLGGSLDSAQESHARAQDSEETDQ